MDKKQAGLITGWASVILHYVSRWLLLDEDIVEKRRGLGMFVRESAQKQLLETERSKFLKEEWPGLLTRIGQLGLDFEQLIRNSKKEQS